MDRYRYLTENFADVRRDARRRVRDAIEADGLRARPAPRANEGILIAEGDSWFDFPGADDVLDVLEDFGFDVRTAAHRGDTLESMVYDDDQIGKTCRLFRKVSERGDGDRVRAILLSGGGNDIAGPALSMLLNHRDSGLDPVSEPQLAAVFEDRLGTALVALVEKVTICSQYYFDRRVPVILHGYARPVPDGRGIGPWNAFAGPWLSPSFEEKGWRVRKDRSELMEATGVMARLIDKFNEMAMGIASQSVFDHVHYVDLRAALPNDASNDDYRDEWNDELHPEDPGFERIANLYRDLITRVGS